MRINFLIDYRDENYDAYETFSCVDISTAEGKKLLHEMLDGFMNNELKNPLFTNQFRVFGGQCLTHNHEDK